MRRRVGEGPPACVLGVGSPIGQELRGERAGPPPLSGARRPGEQVRVDWSGERRGQGGPCGRLVLGGVAKDLGDLGRGGHFERSFTASITRPWTSWTDPSALITMIRSGCRSASSS